MSFSMSHTVTLKHPISIVFPALSESQHMERLQRLTPEAQQFTLLPSNHVQLPPGGLQPFFTPDHPTSAKGLPRPRTMDTVTEPTTSTDASSSDPAIVERVRFEFSGITPLLCGLIHSPLSVAGAQIVERETRTVLFESGVEASGIKELKVRTFQEITVENGERETLVKETVWGTCPIYLVPLLRLIAPGVHKEHMELYHKLFE